MDNSAIVFVANDDVRAIRGVYETQSTGVKEELFKTLNPNVKVDDFVVVESPARHGMSVVKVTEVDVVINVNDSGPIRWIVQHINMPAFVQLKKDEDALISTVQDAERTRARKEMQASMFQHNELKNASLALAHVKEVTEE